MSITSAGGGSASVADSIVVADAVTTCSGSGCDGSVTTTQQTVGLTSTSTAGTILTTVDPADQSAYSCGDSFPHAPQVTTVTDSGLNATIVYTVTFKNAAVAGQWFVPFAVCYQAQTPFKDLYGHTVTTGLLPVCTLLPRPNKPLVAPCVQSITELPFLLGMWSRRSCCRRGIPASTKTGANSPPRTGTYLGGCRQWRPTLEASRDPISSYPRSPARKVT